MAEMLLIKNILKSVFIFEIFGHIKPRKKFFNLRDPTYRVLEHVTSYLV